MNDAGLTPFGFQYWPFDLVPRPGASLIWAARKALKSDITTLMRRMARHSAVSLHLLWADFGAGKTHTLLYLKQECAAGHFGNLLPLYCALPKGCKSFLDIYQSIVRAIPGPVIQSAYSGAVSRVGREKVAAELEQVWPPLSHCFQAITIGGEMQRGIALSWLHAEPGISAKQLQSLSMFGRLRSTDEAVLALCGLVRLFDLAGYSRTVFMVDEFQRVETLRRQQQDEINAGLHGFFNACSRGMSLVLSFSFGVEEHIKHLLNAELLSRVDPLRISIPALSATEGLEFLKEILTLARADAAPWPVTEGAIQRIVSAAGEHFTITPRRLLKAAGLVFDLGALAIEDGDCSELSEEFVDRLVEKGSFKRLDEGESE